MTINDQLQKIANEKRIGLMTHVVIGYPSLKQTIKLVQIMTEEGVDFVELQIPFSDPLADGPVIMRACEDSLAKGVRVTDAFITMKKLTSKVKIPLLFMGYYNTVFRYGVEKFCYDSKMAGAAGLIIPDMPLEEEREEHLAMFAKKYSLPIIRVISPVSTPDRLKKNADAAEGFVYCSARQGITGVRQELNPHLAEYLKTVREFIDKPLAVGFGISTRQHIEAIKTHAQVAVIGSAIIKIIQESEEKEMEQRVRRFLSSLVV